VLIGSDEFGLPQRSLDVMNVKLDVRLEERLG
jgi:hypothetical protein